MLPLADNFTGYYLYVVGSLYSGRSSFIEATCDEFSLGGREYRRLRELPENRETEIDGVFFNFGRIFLLPDTVFYLFSTPYSDFGRFKFPWEQRDESGVGWIVMVDSTASETFKETRRIIHAINKHTSLPCVIAANKQDLPNAWTADDIRIALSIPSEIPGLPCSTLDKKSVANVLIALCEEVIKDSN